ncbi:MAG: fused MFS/spermidine synthase [Coriobacteriia bacterium]|nr:fused MFS/spermidine synthase [Coriobacteriia bacterium]
MLEVIVFACGASLMALEFIAARLLAPTLGSSVFVWGAVISIVMVALSLGYWAGGQIADRFGSTRTLAPVIAGAGLFTVLVPRLTDLVLPLVAGLGARTGSLVASAIVFFAPALLLAMVSPLGVRLAAGDRVDHIGRSAGQLYAISTAGSIVGTIATAFWLIPLLSLDGLAVGIGFVLFAAAGFALLLPRRYGDDVPSGAPAPSARLAVLAIATIVAGVVAGAVSLIGPAAAVPGTKAGEEVIYRKDTAYHRLVVTEDNAERHLRFDRSHQSAMYLDDPYETSFHYPQYLHLALAAKPDAKRVLIVGLGGGSLVKRMWRDYPQMRIDVAEIDPIVVDVAYRYFELPRDERITVTAEDGRRFLAATDTRYDIIVMDAYYADALPSHLATEEFFREVAAHLTPDGVVAYNVIGAVDGERSKLFRSMYRTVGLVWPHRWVFPIGIGEDYATETNRNIIVLATNGLGDRDELLARIADRVGGTVTVNDYDRFGEDLYEGRIETDDVPVLTDAHAPTDSLIEVN